MIYFKFSVPVARPVSQQESAKVEAFRERMIAPELYVHIEQWFPLLFLLLLGGHQPPRLH
jgi:hypothetical protein